MIIQFHNFANFYSFGNKKKSKETFLNAHFQQLRTMNSG